MTGTNILAPSRIVLRETIVSIAINGVLSALFVFLVFGRQDRIGLWGAGGLALDFVPQTFIIAFMATLVPSAITRKALRRGGFHPALPATRKPLPHNLLVRSLIVATAVSAVAVPFAIGAVAVTAPDPLSFRAALVLKVIYGAALACLVTSFAVRIALRDRVVAG